MSFIPYLHFQGQCAEAMAFYAKLFGSQDLRMMRYGEAPQGAAVPGSQRVMHAQFTANGAAFMASDFPDGVSGDAQAAVSVMYAAPDLEAGQRVFQALAEPGGAVIVPYGPSFFAKGFGMLKDRFGTHWIISAG